LGNISVPNRYLLIVLKSILYVILKIKTGTLVFFLEVDSKKIIHCYKNKAKIKDLVFNLRLK
jgi:hypothetical protein